MTSKEWKTVKLGDVIISANTGLDAIKRAPVVDYNTGIKCLRIQDISQNKQFDSWGFCEVEENNFNRFSLKEGDILIARTGATIGVNIQIKDNLIAVYNNGLIRIKINNEITNNKFIFYNLQTRYYKNFINAISAGTSTQPNMQINSLLSFEIPFPPLETQEKIVRILSSLDDKIELNNKINQNLEQQAQAIFKSWFVDFEPFGGNMPKDWKIGELGEYLEIKRGGSPRPIQNFIADKGYKWLKISDVTSLQTPFIYNIKESIRESGLNKTVLLKAGTFVLSNSATPGIPKILGINSCIHDGWLYFPKSKFSNEYLYLLFKSIRKKLVLLGNGSVFTNLKTDILRNYQTVLPSESILKNFDSIVKPIFSNIQNNTLENINLTQLRDTLLPKLMSGEIDVDKVEV